MDIINASEMQVANLEQYSSENALLKFGLWLFLIVFIKMLTALAGALIGIKLMKKHYKKAGLV